jgi:hypothetical protein
MGFDHHMYQTHACRTSYGSKQTYVCWFEDTRPQAAWMRQRHPELASTHWVAEGRKRTAGELSAGGPDAEADSPFCPEGPREGAREGGAGIVIKTT